MQNGIGTSPYDLPGLTLRLEVLGEWRVGMYSQIALPRVLVFFLAVGSVKEKQSTCYYKRPLMERSSEEQ